MTAPQPNPPIQAKTGVHVDPETEAVSVSLRMQCGAVALEALLNPEEAPQFGVGLAQALAQAAQAAIARGPKRLVVAQPGMVFPPMNGNGNGARP